MLNLAVLSWAESTLRLSATPDDGSLYLPKDDGRINFVRSLRLGRGACPRCSGWADDSEIFQRSGGVGFGEPMRKETEKSGGGPPS